MTALSLFLLLIVAALAAQHAFFSFSAQRPATYATTTPAFDIRERLSGPLVSEGIVFGPTGRVSQRFVAEMNGSWDGATGRLTEAFRYSNGTVQNREWTLHLGNDGQIRATAPDIVGEARGWQSGATVQLRYRLRLPESAGGHVLDVIDWLYLTEDGVILNKSEMRKFGIKVAELVATMRPAPADAR
ncbi:MAG: DUF3833 domain-containing protein [Alphaproteobacteria bacterium]|nr:MAG: DUF3833 domain-containing protein [Alphaproteobacteria bacterium]